jgi:hypothetical protein
MNISKQIEDFSLLNFIIEEIQPGAILNLHYFATSKGESGIPISFGGKNGWNTRFV